jgi:L-cysteine S-thiosulfotransferase
VTALRCWPVLLLFAFAALISAQVAAEPAQTALRSASEFLSPAMKSEQHDLALNRGMLWVDQGAALWSTPTGPNGKTCVTCHQAPIASMRGVAARYPKVNATTGQLLNLEGRINACRAENLQAEPLPYESNELLGLTAFVAFQSRGMKPNVDIGGAAQSWFEKGQSAWRERQGQLNVACAQCHDDNVGRKLRGDTISSGVGTGYPAYRLEWQSLGSLHRRLKACQLGVRAIQFNQGAPEYLALELYLAWRARDLPLEAPALRR